jgi:hypothetical protein
MTDPNIIIACVGFGCETDENLNHYAVLENIAELAKMDAFLGSCSLTKDMAEYAKYKAAVENPNHPRKSHIQTRVIAAVEGQFGAVDVQDDANLSEGIFGAPVPPFINPLMSMYWFFRLEGIVKNNTILPALKRTKTISESLAAYREVRTRVREKKNIPL